MWALGIDIGGTFTDLAALDAATGRVETHKLLTTPDDPTRAVLDGTRALMDRLGAGATVDRIVHGTTLVTNAVVERKGAITALVTTRGFRDVLEIRREGRYDLYDLELTFPEPLVPRARRIEAAERIDERGAVLEPLDLAALKTAIESLAGAGVTSWAVVFLHAYANPEHERRAAKVIAARYPGVPVSLSSRVAPEIREYERTSTTVANAYVRPVAEGYLGKLEHGLAAIVPAGERPASLRIMQSDGGMIAPETAAELPIRIVESGPAGGVIAAARLGAGLGAERLLALDMGGTTAKIAFVERGAASSRSGFEMDRRHFYRKGSGLPLLVPSLDLVEIGAGGGSLAARGPLGTLDVGPESAGADPGPAAYDRGGTRATVTDADLVLGLLDPDDFLGGRLRLNGAAAREAIVRDVGDPLGLDPLDAAHGVFTTVGSNMAEAARVHAAERGVNLAEHTLVAFGGAGPVHAWSVARQLRIPRILFPSHAGVESALGFLAAAPAFEAVRSDTRSLDELDPAAVRALVAGLAAEAGAEIERMGTPGFRTLVSVDMRYRGQGAEIRVPLGDGAAETAAIRDAFLSTYRELYGRAVTGVPIETVTWRVRCEADAPAVPALDAAGAATEQLVPAPDPGSAPAPVATRAAWLPDADAPADIPVHRRADLPERASLSGPAIIQEEQSTLVLGRGRAVVLPGGAILAELAS